MSKPSIETTTSKAGSPSSKTKGPKRYLRNCIAWPRDEVASLTAMIEDNRPITLRTFRKHVDRNELDALEQQLGYVTRPWEKGLRMCNDFHVSYHASLLDGEPVVYFRHSAIEYVFVGGSR